MGCIWLFTDNWRVLIDVFNHMVIVKKIGLSSIVDGMETVLWTCWFAAISNDKFQPVSECHLLDGLIEVNKFGLLWWSPITHSQCSRFFCAVSISLEIWKSQVIVKELHVCSLARTEHVFSCLFIIYIDIYPYTVMYNVYT